MVAIIKPDGLTNKNAIIERILQEGFRLLQEKTFQMTLDQATELYGNQNDYSSIKELIEWVSSSDVCALMIQKENAINDFTELLGSKNSSKAKKKKPKSLRALFGKDRFYNAVDGSESLKDAQKEIMILFDQPRESASDTSNEMKSEIMSDPLPSPAASPVIEGSQSTEIESYEQVPDVKEMAAQAIPEDQQNVHADESDTLEREENIVPHVPEEFLGELNQHSTFVQQDDSAMVEQTFAGQVKTNDVTHGISTGVPVEQDVSNKVENSREIVKEEEKTLKKEEEGPRETDDSKTLKEQKDTPIEAEEQIQDPTDKKEEIVAKELKPPVEDKKEELVIAFVQQEDLVQVKESVQKDNSSEPELAQPENLSKAEELVQTEDINEVEEPLQQENVSQVEGLLQQEDVNQVKESVKQENISKVEEPVQQDVIKVEELVQQEDVSKVEESEQQKDVGKVKEPEQQQDVSKVEESVRQEQATASTTNNDKVTVGTTNTSAGRSKNISKNGSKNSSTKTDPSPKPSPASSKNSVRKEAKSIKTSLERPAPSSSRLRQPVVKSSSRSPTNSGKPPLRRVERKPIPSAALKDVKGTSRIAKLTAPKEPEEKKSADTENTLKKKAAKTPKQLPRVALMATQKPKPENTEPETKKTTEVKKKRQSSTKDFINRLTAPTLASINKKSDATSDVAPTPKIKKQTTIKTSKVSPNVATKKRSSTAQPKETKS
ncbi:unnamed protein product [Rhizopus stolonifer]